jgi:Flp pilus assembly protein TadD
VNSVILLVETMLNAMDLVTSQHRAIVEQTVQQNKDNVVLLESVATLRVREEDYEKAVVIYHLIDQIDQNQTKRPRTLNNLAMAYSELEGRESQGLEPIERAIELLGEHEELLDTKGTVLLRSGNFEEAEKVFRSAIAKNDDPRFQFHLGLALLKQGKEEGANRLFNSLDLQKLDRASLTRSDLADLNQITEKLARENN